MSQKATIGCVMYVILSLYMYQRGSRWTSGSQTVLRGSQGIRDQFPGNPCIYL